MKIGISISSSYPDSNPHQGARFMIERARQAHQAGLDSLFVGDHHITRTPYYQNTAILGRLLAEWGDKPVGALYLLPLWNPVLLAEQISTLAAIASGPFIMQCALGGERRQSLGMGTQKHLRVPMFEASLALMQALWRGEEVSETRFWNIDRARISPLPREPIEVWIGSVALPAINRTARLADAWLASPSLVVSEAAAALNSYRQACAEHKRTPRTIAIRKDIYIGADSASAKKTMRPYVEAGYRGFSAEAMLFGSVVEVAEQFAAFAELGFTDIIVRNISADQTESLATIERLAEVKALLLEY
jgi:alkanesulfonate monooxygenase SsuD/methylene tetrahydromethanopterin reductase-like flavin-dependent oxidoreductase (luciferase family)